MRDPYVTKRVELALTSVTKFVASGKRRVRGFASTDSLDRQSDIVEPGGGTWRLPLPLLLQHVHADPVGLVESIERRGSGLWIEASLVEGIGKADEAWRMIEAGLLAGFSIGFIGKKSEPLKSGGLRFLQWELIEISVCTIPANPDAKIQRNLPGIKLIQAGIPLTTAR